MKEEPFKTFTLIDLFNAYYDCRRNKRNSLSALNFEFNLEQNLLDLYYELKNGTYKIGESICFVVEKPKPREVWAADFRDRIVHHLVYNAIKERFHRRFIYDSYSCIPEKGTLLGCHRLQHFSRSITQNYTKKAHYLKADVSNFFVSIDKKILFAELEKLVNEEWILELLQKIIYNDPRENVMVKSEKHLFKKIPPHKSLWNAQSTKGLPIGNLTSQFFSNVYLNVLDQFVKRELKCKYYGRYVDDFFILHENPEKLNQYFLQIDDFIQTRLNLKLHPLKKSINKVSSGIDFIGFVVKPGRTYLRKHTVKNSFNSAKRWKENPNKFDLNHLKNFRAKINSYLGMMQKTSSFNTRKKLCLSVNNLFVHSDEDYSKLLIIN